jgi:GAF domain-containing protein
MSTTAARPLTRPEPGLRPWLRAQAVSAATACNATAASVSLHDPDTASLVISGVARSDEQHLVGHHFPASTGIAGWVFLSGEPIAVGDVRHDERFAHAFAQRTGFVPERIAAAALPVNGEAAGVLQVLDYDRGMDEDQILAVIEEMGVACGQALELLQQAALIEGLLETGHDDLVDLGLILEEVRPERRRMVLTSLEQLAKALLADPSLA